jgi:hypothetical protein
MWPGMTFDIGDNTQESFAGRSYAHTIAPRRDAPASMLPRLGGDSKIQVSPRRPSRESIESEITDDSYLDLLECRRELQRLEEAECNRLLGEDGRTKEEEAWYVPKWERNELLPSEMAPPGDPSEWVISAPLIERAIQRYYARYHRVPTEAELEGEVLHGCYREILTLLKDLEVYMLHLEGRPCFNNEWCPCLSDGSEGGVVLSCLRSEMQRLFMDAISSLPTLERLIITVDHEKYSYETRVDLTLQIRRGSLVETPIRAYLSVRALLPNPDLGELRPRTRRLLSEPTNGEITEGYRENSRLGSLVDWDVKVYGSQSGLLPIGLHGKWTDKQAAWTREFTSIYCLDDEHHLIRTSRKECYQLRLER